MADDIFFIFDRSVKKIEKHNIPKNQYFMAIPFLYSQSDNSSILNSDELALILDDGFIDLLNALFKFQVFYKQTQDLSLEYKNDKKKFDRSISKYSKTDIDDLNGFLEINLDLGQNPEIEAEIVTIRKLAIHFFESIKTTHTLLIEILPQVDEYLLEKYGEKVFLQVPKDN